MGRAAETGAEPDLVAKVALLQDARSYSEPTGRIEAIETHMSWVFLGERLVYKLKKPVRYDFLDFSSLAARAHYCAEEVRLNAPLAPGVYLGAVPLARAPDGRIRVDGRGEPVDWLVKMRRLPADRMLDALLARGAVPADALRAVARRLADFYRALRPAATDGAQYRRRLEARLRDNLEVLVDPDLGLAADRVRRIHRRMQALLEQLPRPFEQRAATGRVVEGHGDLRPEHVCLESPPLIFDRLEFNRELRIVDALEEVAGLAMECERLGGAAAGATLLREYLVESGDDPPPAVTQFYMAHRACVRARLAILHLRELAPPAWPRWQRVANAYLELAERYALTLPVQFCPSSTSEPPV